MRPARLPLAAVAAVALAGFASSSIFSGWLGWRRDMFVAGHGLVVGLVAGWVVRTLRVRPAVQLRRRWRAGLIVGVAAGALLARSVMAAPAGARPEGAALPLALFWLGAVYGTLDAVLLTVLPVLLVYGTRPADAMRGSGTRLRWGAVALAASLAVTAAYHVGFAEFRGRRLAEPLLGNAVATTAYLLSGSPVAPITAQVMMHAAAVLRGPSGTSQLPPHDRAEPPSQ